MALKDEVNKAQPNNLIDAFRALGIGNVLVALPTRLNNKAPAADAAQLATLAQVGLPADAKAATILRAYARKTSAAGTLGELAIQAFGATPADGQIAVAPNGDIVTLLSSAYTAVDLEYMPDKYDVLVITLPVVPGTGVCALPTGQLPNGPLFIIDANAIAGTATGRKKVLVPAAGAPAAGQVRLDVAKANAQFAVADAVSQATFTFAIPAAIDIQATLEADPGGIL